MDDELLAKVDGYESSDLSESQKAALRVADAYLGAKPNLDEQERKEVLAVLPVPQVVETVLKLMQWSSDKVMVALRQDLDEVTFIRL